MKMDPSPPRYFVLERKSNSSFPTLGWLTADAETLDVIGARLRDLAISSSPLADADLRFRQAAGGLRFVCHNGISHEIVYGREIGRAHVLTPVTNAHLVCRLLLEKKKTHDDDRLEHNNQDEEHQITETGYKSRELTH